MTTEKRGDFEIPSVAAMIREAIDRKDGMAGQLCSDLETEDYIVVEQGMLILYAHFPSGITLKLGGCNKQSESDEATAAMGT